MERSSYIHNALHDRCHRIGVEGARIARRCGDEMVLVEQLARMEIS